MERQLKILFLVSNDHFTDQRMQRICNTLHKRGHEVHLIGRALSNPVKTYPYVVHLTKLAHNNGPFFYYGLMINQVKIGRTLSSFDIISSVDADTLLAGKKLAKLHNAKHIHDAHEWFIEVPELNNKKVKKWIWKMVERRGLKELQAMYTVSEGLATYYQQLTKAKVQLIKNYPNKQNATPINSEKRYDIIYQGAINEGRCLDLLLNLCVKENYSLCVCGVGDLYSMLKNKYGNASNVTFKGNVSPKKLHSISMEARIGYNMLDNSSLSYNESLPNKTFDYIQAEIPQLISGSKALVRLNNDCIFALQCELNYESMNLTIKHLLNDQKTYDNIVKNTQKLKLAYNWEKQEQKLIGIYEQF